MASGSDDERTVISPRIARGRAVPASLSVGTVLGHTYRIEALVAGGRVGEVYRARHVELGTTHALKVIRPSLAGDPKLIEMLVDEARKLARVRHDAIVGYEGFFRDEQGLRYLVMEYVEGEQLSVLLSHRRLEPLDVLRLRDRLAHGLAAAHEQGIVHRDVSPENIIVPDGDVGRAKLIDFGIAQSAEQGERTMITGSRVIQQRFAAPEQFGLGGGHIDARTDIYALGLVLAAAALGFGKTIEMGADPISVLAARQRVPDLSRIPAALQGPLAAMLAPNPADRPGSMLALLDEARTLIAPREFSGGSRPPGKRRAFLMVGGAAAAVLAVGGALALFLLRPQTTEPELRAALASASAGYECASIQSETGADRTVHLTGHVSTAADLDRLRAAIAGIRGVGAIRSDVAVVGRPDCEPASERRAEAAPKAPSPPPAAAPPPTFASEAGPAKTAEPPAPPPAAAAPQSAALPAPPPTDGKAQLAALNDALIGLDCAAVTARGSAPGESARLDGTVPSEEAKAQLTALASRYFPGKPAELDVTVIPPPLCHSLASLAALRHEHLVTEGDLRAQLFGSNGLREGDLIKVEVHAPGWGVSLRIDYFSLDGQVQHLWPNDRESDAKLAPGEAHVFGDGTSGKIWRAGGAPFGTEAIAVIATPLPLNLGPVRPVVEKSGDYLREVAASLADNRAIGAPNLLTTILVTTHGR